MPDFHLSSLLAPVRSSRKKETNPGMLVEKHPEGFGMRSWRYAVIINDGNIEEWFIEPGFCDNCPTDPYGETKPENILKALKGETSGEKVYKSLDEVYASRG